VTASRYAYCDLEATFEKREDAYLVKDAVMANRSAVKVHRFNPPALAPMREIAPDIAARAFTIYLPPSYGVMEDRRYPVIYLLHGNTQNHLSYFGTYSGGFGLNLQSVLDELASPNGYREVILVVPDGDLPESWMHQASHRGSFFVNSAHNGAFETYVAEDLVDCVENNADHCLWNTSDEGYRVIRARQSRGLHGMCMGALGAMNMALRYPGKFTAVVGNFGITSLNEFIFPYSGDVEPLMVGYLKEPDLQEVMDTRLATLAPSLDGEHYPDNEFPIFLGPDGEVLMTMVEDPENPVGPQVELWSAFYLRSDPYTYLAEHPEAIEGLSFYIDAGATDEFQLFENNSAFSALLADLGLAPSLDIGPESRHFFEIYESLSHVDHITFHRIRKALEFLLNHLKG